MSPADGAVATTWILVVSDDERIRDAAGYGFDDSVAVTFAADAREAVEILREGTPAVMVVDMQAGSAGGYALCRDMAADPRLDSIPVLMLLERDQDSWLATQAGADLHRTKPIDAAELVDVALSLKSSD